MRLDEQRTTAHAIDYANVLPDANVLPGTVRVSFRIGADEREVGVTQGARYPYRSELRIDDIRTTTRVRGLGDINQCNQLPVLGINNSYLVRLVRRSEEVTLGSIPTAIMQELRCGKTSRICPVSLTLTINSGCSCDATIAATRGSGWYS